MGNVITRKLIDKYCNNSYGMYVEYPHKSAWSEDFGDPDLRAALKSLFSTQKSPPLLLYAHIPFCPKQCYFCTCYSMVTKDYQRVKNYLSYLYREIDLFNDFFSANSITPDFEEIHIGGGSPTYLGEKEFDSLIAKLQSLAKFKHVKEFTIEIDPRVTTKERLLYYHSKGINRISIGVQDFEVSVQKAVNRIQPPELIESLLAHDIRKYFGSVNFDILCGLPRQTLESFKKTIETVVKLAPDRVCIIHLTYSPDLKKHQRLMKESEFPTPYERAMLLDEGARILVNNGYVRIGFDHFAKPTDSLAKAFKRSNVHWNALGYRAGDFIDIIGLGASSANRITERYYSQNFYELPEYQTAIDSGRFPVYRGYKLGKDHIIRRGIMHSLRSYFVLNIGKVEKQHSINFNEYFKGEKLLLEDFAKDGILKLSNTEIAITELGKHFTFLVCRIFDKFNKINRGTDVS